MMPLKNLPTKRQEKLHCRKKSSYHFRNKDGPNFYTSLLVFPICHFTMLEIFGAELYHNCACDSTVIFRATKSQYSQIFSAFFKAYETSTNQISRLYHE